MMIIGFIQKLLDYLNLLLLLVKAKLKEFCREVFMGTGIELQGHVIKNKRITGMVWFSSSYSVTVTLPKKLAEKHGLNKPCTVIFEDRPDGILIKKLDLD